MARLPDAVEPAQPEGAPEPYRWLVLFGLWLIYVTFGMTTASLAPLVAPITRELGISHGSMGFVFGVWQIAYIVSAVPCGGLHDRIGVTRSLFLGGMIVAASALLRSLAFDYVSLCLAVVLFGIGGPIISTGSPKVVSNWFTGPERGFAMGIYVTGSAVGTILSLSLTNSVLMPAFGQDWHRVLQLWSILGLCSGLVWLAISAHPRMRRKEALAAAQPRQSQRAVIAALLRLPSVRLLLAMSVGTFVFNHSLNNWLPEILRSRGFSAAQAGFWATTPTIVGIIGALTLPRLAIPKRRHWMMCVLCGAAVLATLLLQAKGGPLLVAGMVLQGIARSSLVTVTMLTLVETPGVGERNAAIASGLFFTAAEMGGASGPILLGLVHDATGGFSTGLALLTAVTSLLLAGAFHLRQQAMTVQPEPLIKPATPEPAGPPVPAQ
jgi:MFS transporter, CP family, cyanate transporter